MKIATFVLSVLGTVLAASSLGWQAATYFLTGGRVRVELRVGAFHQSGSGLVTARPRDIDGVSADRLAGQGYTRPVVAVRVRATGRLPVTVERWSIQCPKADFSPVADSIGPPLPFRLEAGSSETWAVDAPAISSLASTAKEVFNLRAVPVWGKVELGNGRVRRTREKITFE